MRLNLDFFFWLTCRLFLRMMHSHFTENSWRYAAFILPIIYINSKSD
jgi:hypothetical protein